MNPFIDNCIIKVKEKHSHLIVGLDPHYDLFPEYLQKKFTSINQIGNCIFEFNKRIIEATYDLVPIVKPQIAFFERFGLEGLKAYKKTIDYAHKKGLLVIGDIKRSDIDSTAKAYSDAHLGKTIINGKNFLAFNVDAVTVNPYLGSDGINPFIEDAAKYGKGIFVLVKTSNKSSIELQDLSVNKNGNNLKLYEVVGSLVSVWGERIAGKFGYSSVGAVVGATFPTQISELRKIMPNNFFLIPGIGAQGGAIKDIMTAFNQDRLGALINVSRSVIFAYKNNPRFKSKDFDLAAREEVIRLNNELTVNLNG